jgi:hypothetical protein
VNLFLKDLKRKIRTILQIDTTTGHLDQNTKLAKHQPKSSQQLSTSETGMTTSSSIMSNTDKIIKRNSSEIMETALNKYLKLRSVTFDLTKVIDVSFEFENFFLFSVSRKSLEKEKLSVI